MKGYGGRCGVCTVTGGGTGLTTGVGTGGRFAIHYVRKERSNLTQGIHTYSWGCVHDRHGASWLVQSLSLELENREYCTRVCYYFFFGDTRGLEHCLPFRRQSLFKV